jgi:XTP/dITP diphosphohydrolase
MKILLATHNPAKLTELTKAFTPLPESQITLISLKDLHIDLEPAETGKTFEDNSLLKAKYYAKITNLPTIGDDGGIAIGHLNGEPGVKSKRWLGRDATDEELIDYTLSQLQGVPRKMRGASMVLTLTFFDPATGTVLTETESIKGHIAESPSPRRTHGFPFRSLFIVDAYGKFYDELTLEEHAKINHRMKAAARLSTKLQNFLLQ